MFCNFRETLRNANNYRSSKYREIFGHNQTDMQKQVVENFYFNQNKPENEVMALIPVQDGNHIRAHLATIKQLSFDLTKIIESLAPNPSVKRNSTTNFSGRLSFIWNVFDPIN